MKNIVINDEFKATDFKPSALLLEYANLTAQEIPQYFNKTNLVAVACPVCASYDTTQSFDRFGMTYQVCQGCLTWYVSPRPKDVDIVSFYQKSKARQFWNEKIYQATAMRRNEKIIKPRFQWVEDSTAEYLPKATRYVDIHANQLGYIKEIQLMKNFSSKTLINPLVPVPTDLVNAGIVVNQQAWWDVKGSWDVVTLFEVIDHTSDVKRLLRQVHDMLNKDGLCFLTGILASGFDLLVLKDKANHVFPPDRLNALTVEAVNILAQAIGFECLEISTPGILDLPIVASAKAKDPSIQLGSFVDYLLTRPENQQQEFTAYLQSNMLSSYGRILLRKV